MSCNCNILSLIHHVNYRIEYLHNTTSFCHHLLYLRSCMYVLCRYYNVLLTQHLYYNNLHYIYSISKSVKDNGQSAVSVSSSSAHLVVSMYVVTPMSPLPTLLHSINVPRVLCVTNKRGGISEVPNSPLSYTATVMTCMWRHRLAISDVISDVTSLEQVVGGSLEAEGRAVRCIMKLAALVCRIYVNIYIYCKTHFFSGGLFFEVSQLFENPRKSDPRKIAK